jgi:DNA-binding NtrC family response regulator
VVDDEKDVLDAVAEMLEMCTVHKMSDYETALQYLLSYTYDIVVLDIMGVRGFDLLKVAVKKGFPTVMLTAHALTSESLKKSIRQGAVSFLPKERMGGLVEPLEDVMPQRGKPAWQKLFEKVGDLFNKRFGPDWKEKDRLFKEFEEELRKSEGFEQGAEKIWRDAR